MMFKQRSQKQSILKISFHRQAQLNFTWDFKGLLNCQFYYKHLFLVNSQNIAMRQFLQSYYSKLKDGSLFKIVNNQQTIKSTKWIQKNKEVSFPQIQFNSLSYQSLLRVLKKLMNDSKLYSQTIVIYLLTDQLFSYKQKKELQKIINSLRIQGCLKFIVNVLGEFPESNVNSSDGINYFRLDKDNIQDVSIFLQSYLNRIVAIYGGLELQCFNGTLNIEETTWKTTTFNKIKLNLYGITQYQTTQRFIITDLASKQKQYKQYTFKLTITYQLMNLKVYQSEKIFIISISQQLKNKKFTVNPIQRKQLSLFNLAFQKNPFINQSKVWLTDIAPSDNDTSQE